MFGRDRERDGRGHRVLGLVLARMELNGGD